MDELAKRIAAAAQDAAEQWARPHAAVIEDYEAALPEEMRGHIKHQVVLTG